MLNLGLDIDIDVKKVHFPIHFEHKNICVHCGDTGSLIFVDKFGRESSQEINAFDHIKCKSCGRIYSILWERKDSGSDKMYPSAIDPSIKREFKNLINGSEIKRAGVKEL